MSAPVVSLDMLEELLNEDSDDLLAMLLQRKRERLAAVPESSEAPPTAMPSPLASVPPPGVDSDSSGSGGGYQVVEHGQVARLVKRWDKRQKTAEPGPVELPDTESGINSSDVNSLASDLQSWDAMSKAGSGCKYYTVEDGKILDRFGKAQTPAWAKRMRHKERDEKAASSSSSGAAAAAGAVKGTKAIAVPGTNPTAASSSGAGEGGGEGD